MKKQTFSRLFKYAVSFILFLFIANVTYSEVKDEKGKYKWVNIFPVGTEIHSLAIDPQNTDMIYASTYKGLFKSENGGKLWMPLLVFKPHSESTHSIIKIDPISSKTLYWAVYNKKERQVRFWRSKDGGLNWEDMSAGVINDEIYGIALNPKSPEILYVASKGGLYKTFNGGKTWGKIAGAAYNVFLDPNSPDEVYASIEDRGGVRLLYSKDGGLNFDLIRFNKLTPYGEEECGGNVHDSAYALLHLTDNQRMLVSCNHGGGGQSISKSFDGGKTWEFIRWEKFVPEAKDKETAHIVGNIIYWSFHPKDKNVIYFAIRMKEFTLGGDREWPDKILKSTDGGNTWIPLSSPPQMNIGQIVVISDAIFVTTDFGLYKTINDGKTWEICSFGLPTKVGDRELRWIDTKSGGIYVSSKNGYWISSNQGLSWEWNSFPRNILWAYSNSNARQIFVAADKTEWTLLREESGMSARWHVLKTLLEGKPTKIETAYSPRQLAVSPSNPKVLYLSTRESNPWTDSFPDGDILLKSEDAGFSWIKNDWLKGLQMEQGSYYHHIVLLLADPVNQNILFMVTTHSIKGIGNPAPSRAFSLLKTIDGGNTWSDISQNLYKSIETIWSSSKWLNPKERHHIANLLVSSPTSIVIDPSNSNTVYITTKDGGIYRSDDGGKTWGSKSPMNYLKTLITAFDNYSAQQCKGQKNCKGVTLDTALKGGIIMMAPQNTVIVYPQKVLDEVGFSFKNVIIDSLNPKIIYIATNNGVYKSPDRGDTWQLINQGLLDTAVRKILASPSLILAEGENGIYKLSE